MDPVTALTARNGSSPWKGLSRSVSRGTLLAAVAAGTVLRPARDVYALPGADAAQVAALAVGGLVSCQSAAAARSWELLRPPTHPHVTAGVGSKREWRRATVHRIGPAPEPGGLCSRDQTVLTALRCLPTVVERVVLLDGLLRAGEYTESELLALCAKLGPRDPRRRAFELMDGRSQSVLESAVRVACVLAGLRVEVQVFLAGVGWVDLLVEGWLVVETDGRTVHESRFVEDRRRDVGTALLGGMTLRFTWWDVVNRLDETVQEITAVALAGPRGRGVTPRLLS